MNVPSRAVLAVLALGVIAPTIASATVTQSNVTSPVDFTRLVVDDDVLSPAQLTVSGTSDGALGDPVEVRCYWTDTLGAHSNAFATTDVVAADGSWSITDAADSFEGNACTLLAVDPGDPAGQPTSAHTGPRIFVAQKGSLLVSGGPNDGRAYDYAVTAPQTTGSATYSSAGSCGLNDSRTLTASNTLVFSNPLSTCSDSLGRLDISGTRSAVRVDGQHAYMSRGAKDLFSGADQLVGFPALNWTGTFDANNALALTEQADLARCSSNTFPATPASCTQFVAVGVRLNRTIVQDRLGRRATITDRWSSTDGQNHSLDAAVHDEQRPVPAPGASFRLPWVNAAFQTQTPGILAAGPAGPDTISVRGRAGAPDGDHRDIRGAIVFDTVPSQVKFATSNPSQSFDSTIVRTVPAVGGLTMRRVYVWGENEATVDAEARAGLDAYGAPTVRVDTPVDHTTVDDPNLTVTGVARDNVGVTSVTVDGAATLVGAGGRFSQHVVLHAGSNLIHVTATDAAGNTSPADVEVTYMPRTADSVATPKAAPQVTHCTVPKLVGRTFSKARPAIRAGLCRVGHVDRAFSHRPKGEVVRQAIPAGWRKSYLTSVRTTVSAGPAPRRR